MFAFRIRTIGHFVPLGLSVLMIGVLSAHADTPPKAAPVEIGKAAPAFTLTDQTGAKRSLDDLRKNGPVAIVFYRSSQW